jgi:hypothetical protein
LTFLKPAARTSVIIVVNKEFLQGEVFPFQQWHDNMHIYVEYKFTLNSANILRETVCCLKEDKLAGFAEAVK